MLNRCLTRLPALAAMAVLVGLALTTVQPVQAQDKSKATHLQIALYEIREAKLDVREIKGDFPDNLRVEILGTLDATTDVLRKCIQACGIQPQYIKPPAMDYKNDSHLRHAIRALKECKEHLKTEKIVPEDLRADALKLLTQAITQCEKALPYVKK